MNNLRHWVFDLDGTLIDSFSDWFLTLDQVLSPYGIVLNEADFARSLTMYRDQFLAGFLNPEQVVLASKIIQDRNEIGASSIQSFPGIQHSLQLLKDMGMKMAVWTGRDLKSATMILEKTGLSHFFEICVGANCVENRKPHPDGLAKIQKHWNCDTNSIVMIGDHDVDMQGAKTFGVFATRVSWVHGKHESCSLANNQFIQIEDFNQWIRSIEI